MENFIFCAVWIRLCMDQIFFGNLLVLFLRNSFLVIHPFYYKEHFYKQRQAEIAKKSGKF